MLDEQALQQRALDTGAPAAAAPDQPPPMDVFKETPILAAAIRDSGDSDAAFEEASGS